MKRSLAAVLAAFVIGSSPLKAKDPSLGLVQLRITIYDQAALKPGDAQTAFERLSLTLRQAGITADLRFGDPNSHEAFTFNYVSAPAQAGWRETACRARRDIAVRIIASAAPGVSYKTLGIASPLASTGLNIQMFNDHILEAAFRHNRPYPLVLSYAIAHEIGHVLQRGGEHAQAGIMVRAWTDREYAQMDFARLMFFNPDESRRMREDLERSACRD